jgi:hypothetical protein
VISTASGIPSPSPIFSPSESSGPPESEEGAVAGAVAGGVVAPSASDGVVGVDAMADDDSEVLLLLPSVLVGGLTGNLSRVSLSGR